MSDKQTFLANLRKAREILAAAPEEQFDLHYFKVEKILFPQNPFEPPQHCGTLMCSLGWLASSSEFNDRIELYQDEYGMRNKMWRVRDAMTKVEKDFDFLNPIFGENAYIRLFEPRNDGCWDAEHPAAEVDEDGYYRVAGSVTDKELALWRIDQQIEFVNNTMES